MGQLFSPRRFGPVTLVVVLAIGYYLAGRLAVLMAIPPGYAAPVWPAAGLALAGLLRFGYRAWPGIVLGSFCINFPISYAAAGAAWPAAGVALALGFGAAAQALAGAYLVNRGVDQPLAHLPSDRIGALLVLGGPIACLIGATVGVATLGAAGVVPRTDMAFHWFTWWVGDSIGVLVVMPLFLVWSAPRELLPRRAKMIATVPTVVLLMLVTLVFTRTSALEQERDEVEFKQRSDRVAHTLSREFAEYSEVLHAVTGFYTVAEAGLDRDEFRRLVADVLVRQPGVHALSWSPRVTSAQRAAYEQGMREEGHAQFQIRELGPNNELVPAAERAEYFPVTYIEPLGRHARAVGFDLASEPDRRAILVRARSTATPTTSNQLKLVQFAGLHRGVLMVAPAYWPTMPHATPVQRERAIRGYASAVLRVDQMMALFLKSLDVHDMRIRLLDRNAPPAERVLYATPGAHDSAAKPGVKGATLTRTAALNIGGQSWLLAFTLTPEHSASERSLVAWSVLVAGLLFTGLFSAFLLVTLGRSAAVEAQVRQRTAELKQANDALQVSIEGHARSEAALLISEHEARTVVETARDAYVAMDEHGHVQDWNREAERTFGWSHAEAVGRRVADLIIPEHYRATHTSRVANFIATGEGGIINRRIEVEGLHRDGHAFPIEVTVWSTPHDSTHRFHAFLHDISGRQRAVQRLAAQAAAAAALVASATLSDAAPKILQSVCTALGWRMGALWMIDPESNVLRCIELWQQPDAPVPAFATITRKMTLARGQGLPGRVWSSGKPLWIADVTADGIPRAPQANDEGLHTSFAFPVISSGEVLGVVELFTDSIEPQDEGLLVMMDTLGNLLGEFAARKRAEASLYEEKERAEVTLRSIGDGVIVIDVAGRITYINPVAEEMTGWGASDAVGKPVVDVLRLVAHQSGEASLNPLLVAISENRPLGLAGDTDIIRRDGLHVPIEDSAAPIHDRNGNIIGSVMVFHDVSESRTMAQKMSHLAQHDFLTDLPNRVLLQDRFAQAIARAKRENGHLALLYTDLDGFKHINDSLGHTVGDLLLQQISHRLLHSVRSVDTVSRQGGDEFVILLPELRSSTDAVRVADHILEAMRHPFHIANTELNVTLSIGISMFPGDGDEPGVLLKYADAAMYQAKQHGRNQYRFYTRAISERADRRLLVESSLHQALRNDEFVLHYQPKVDPKSGDITGMEALVRWQPPNGPLCYPDEFIEIAEESGLISRIDQWVLAEACRQNREWQKAGLLRVPIAVNLSAAHANAERYPDELAAILARTGLDPDCLHIEITERQMLHDTDRFATLIHGIKETGAKVAIDDFGTGYSSLGYLCRFSFDVLKIDRTFVQSLGVDSKEIAIVEAISQLARTFGYVVVAEGVETMAQATILQAHGCHEMQGYLYSRPVPAAELEVLLRGRRIVPVIGEAAI